MIWRHLAHYGIHFIVPIIVAVLFFKGRQRRAAIILLLGIAIDIDHVWAEPIFDPQRCSLGFHPLHSYALIPVYVLLALWPKTRLIGLALTIHIIADGVDCLFINS